jgi:hypothetical protein
MKQPATDSGSLVRRLNGHLGQLKFFVSDANQCAATDASFPGSREENPATRIQNSSLRIGKNRLLLWLDTEEAGDPFFIQPPECSGIPWLKLADADFGDRRGLFLSKTHVHNTLLDYSR